MVKIPHKSAEELQHALLRFGDAAFRICYMHTKSPEDTCALLEHIFTQYFLRTKPFRSEEAERLWVMRTTHLACMDYYAAKLRKPPTAEQVRAAAQNENFVITDALYTILTLPYPQLTALALVCGAGESEAFAAKVTGRSAKRVQTHLRAAAERSGLSEDALSEQIATITFSEDMRGRVQNAILAAAEDEHFTVNAYAAKWKRGVNRHFPYAVLGVLVLCLFCVYAVRAGMFGSEYIRSDAGGSAVLETSRVTNDDPPGITLDLRYFVPDGETLIQYNCTMEADAILLMDKMAEKGAFPTDVVLRDLLLIKNGEVVDSLKSGEPLQVRLLFSENLQAALDSDTHPGTTLEAIARSLYAFYDAAGLTLTSLEICAGDAAVTIGGETADCTTLLRGTREITEIIKE